MVKNMELPSNDGVHKLHVVVWQPDGAPKAVLLPEVMRIWGIFARSI